MKNPHWAKAIKSAADPQRAKQFLNLLSAASAKAGSQKMSDEQARILASLFSGSPVLSNLLIANPDWLTALDPESIRHPRREQGFRREVTLWLNCCWKHAGLQHSAGAPATV